MKLIIFFIFLTLANLVEAGTTLACSAAKKCDGYFQNCTPSDYSFSVHVEPKTKSVIIGSVIPANFDNPAEVTFKYLGYTVVINRYEYSATLFNKNETITAWCKKTDAAW